MLGCQKGAFSLPEGLHYLNCAYMAPLPKASEEAGIEGLRRKRDPSLLRPGDFFTGSDELRSAFASLIGGGDGRRVAIHPGASYGIAVAARNLPVGPGQNVVLTAEQFPGNVHAWRKKAAESRAQVRTVGPPPGPGRGEGWNRLLLEAIDARTAVVAVPHVHWTDGTRFDLSAVGRRCRDVGAALVVDGTQSVGALPFDVADIRPDALVCALYKCLLGPYSMALTWLSERFDQGTPLEETWLGREGSDDFRRLVDYRDEYRPGAERYDVAERSNFALTPVALASLGLLRAWTPAGIQAYCRALTEDRLDALREMGFSVEDEAWRASHLFGIRMRPGTDLGRMAEALEHRRVVVSLRGTAVRVSPHVYNDDADVDALLEGLREAAG